MAFPDDEDTERDFFSVTLRRGPHLKPTPFLQLDDGAWWEDD
jgi:hypothetical protein